jgi:hypothetical protein
LIVSNKTRDVLKWEGFNRGSARRTKMLEHQIALSQAVLFIGANRLETMGFFKRRFSRLIA